ncbi:hypothetical protein CXB51_036605 [Gossypium anomalum]|uniref:Integrase catalytic domain-containing protein n=1 Tax=Gossypium anomalum TaxID=47600 RepID=A0A8J5Y0J0_9ROSI|nr:hypothetical protein CXB51_036605 [Gossypium anomalum]
MAITYSPDFDSVEPGGSVFTGDRIVTSFPRHDVVKLDEGTFLQWQQQVLFILTSYDLLGFLDGTLSALVRYVHDTDGSLVANPSATIFTQQDNLLTSWLLSTISSSFLSSFTDMMASSLFAADTSAKQSYLRHKLHSLKKSSLSIRAYVDKIKSLCALLAASGSPISEAERTAILLTGLSSEFDAIVSTASLSSTPLPFQCLIDTLLECEARQMRSMSDVLVAANFVDGSSPPVVDVTSRGGRPPVRGRGRGFRSQIQCQICARYGHLAQRCYYRYHRDEPSQTVAPMVFQGGRTSVPIVDALLGTNRSDYGRGQTSMLPGQNWGVSATEAPVHYFRSNVGAISTRGPHAFVAPGNRFSTPGLHAVDNDAGHISPYYLGQHSGADHAYGARARGPLGVETGSGPSGSIRPRLSDEQNFSEPNVNCVNVFAVPWRKKSRARVFDVNSSSYDSSQFIGIPQLPDFNASDFSDATAYNSNFNRTDSYVPLPVGSTSWCPDSSATHHVCQNASNLHASSPYTGESSLLMGNGVPTKISSIESTVLPTTKKLLHLLNVLCVPSIRKNLLYVSQFATDNNVFFEFHPSYCVIKDIQTQEILMRGQVRDGLYQFSVASAFPSPSAHNTDIQERSTGDTFTLWHRRLGHPSSDVVKTVLDTCQIVTNKRSFDNICIAYQQGKSHKLPFSNSTTEYNDLFELVFQQMVSTQFGKRIRKFQSDWGGEFRAFASVLARYRILHRVTCPYTSEQNGVAERKHRHIVETGLTLLAQANLPMIYWGYAFCSAVHLINRLPTSVLQDKTPYQCLFGSIPTYDHLRVFRCCCFPYLRLFNKHKLDFRSQPSTFLGYSSQHKGYYCLTPSGKIIVSRHVVFDEYRFLFPTSAPTTVQFPACTSFYVPVVRSFPTTVTRQHSDLEPLPNNSCDSLHLPSSTSNPLQSTTIDIQTDFPIGGRESPPSTSSDPLLAPPVATNSPVSTTNTHAIITRSEAEIFKPKALTVTTPDFEPVSIDEALTHPDWKLVVQAEYDALLANSTWELSPLPPGRKVIGCKWLFKVKKNPDGTIERRKARLVAKGCSQVPGCDFQETFSPVVKPTTIRLILSITQPPGFVQHGSNAEKLVCRLTKALYGLRQAPRAWFNKLKEFLVSTGFVLSKSDASLFVKVTSKFTLYVLVYVDDIVTSGSAIDEINRFVQQLHNQFALKDIGDLHYFLGIEVSRSSSGSLHLCQQKYIRELFDRSSMTNAKGVHTPRVSSSMLYKDEGEPLTDPTEYRSLAGALQYVVLTRPDIAYAVNRVCQFMHAPTTVHVVALKRILRYLRGTLSHGLMFCRSDRLSLVGYADANWGHDFDDRRSTTGYCVYFGQIPISWSSKKQQVVSRSTAEAEYRSVAAVASDIAWLVSLLTELRISSIDSPMVASGELVVGEVPACDQVADILTKPLTASLFTRFRNLLRVKPLEEQLDLSLVYKYSKHVYWKAAKKLKKRFSLSPENLRFVIEDDIKSGLVPLFLCATIGTTPSGAVDPIAELGKVAMEFKLWLHIDAAYAGSGCICPELCHYLDGVELANSISMNPYKWFLTNMDCCCPWIKEPKLLVDSLSTDPKILRNNASKSKAVVDYKDLQIALSRRFRALKLWVVIRRHGLANLMYHIQSVIAMAKRFEALMGEDERFEIVVPRKFALVCFRLKPKAEEEDLNYKLVEAINSSGRAFMSHAVLSGIYVIRCAIGTTLTQQHHVDDLWKLIQDKAKSLLM